MMSNFGATPVTGTYIDIDGAGGAWSTWGKPTLYQDSVIFIAQTVPGGSAIQPRVGIVWCEPNQPTVGYTQTGYADFWNMIQTGTDPLYAVWGTNDGLYCFREATIEVASGTPSISFSTTATRSAISAGVGSLSPWSICQFADTLFFHDNRARPWMLRHGGRLEPIWQQMATRTQGWSTTILAPSLISTGLVGAVVPELNQVLLSAPGLDAAARPTAVPCFDATTGVYAGDWFIGQGDIHGHVWTGFDVLDQQINADGLPVLCGIGAGTPDNGFDGGGYVHILQSLNANVWVDVPTLSTVSCTAALVGYAADRNMQPDYVTFITTTSGITSVAITTNYGTAESTLNVVPVDGGASLTPISEYRSTLGLNGSARRWMAITVSAPSIPTAQWGLQRIEVFGTTSGVGPADA